MTLRLLLALMLLVNLSCFTMYSQPMFSLGAKGAFGISPSPIDATLNSLGNVQKVKPFSTLSEGAIVQYLIADLFGVESGFLINFYSYIPKNKNFSFKYPKDYHPTVEISDNQIPLLFILKRNRLFNPFNHFKFIAGTSVDWITANEFSKSNDVSWLKNIIVGIRVGNDKIKYGRVEYGFEYQYSLKRFSLRVEDY